MAHIIRRGMFRTLQCTLILNLRRPVSLIVPRKLGNDSVFPLNSSVCECPAAMFSSSLTTFSKMIRDQKIELLDENDAVIKPEATHKEAHDVAKQKNLKLTILNDPESNDVVAFKLMTDEQYKTHNVNSQQKNPRVKIFKINSASSEHDRDIQYGKIEKVLKKGHPAIVTVIARSRAELEAMDSKTKEAKKLNDTFKGFGFEVKRSQEFVFEIKPKN